MDAVKIAIGLSMMLEGVKAVLAGERGKKPEKILALYFRNAPAFKRSGKDEEDPAEVVEYTPAEFDEARAAIEGALLAYKYEAAVLMMVPDLNTSLIYQRKSATKVIMLKGDDDDHYWEVEPA